MTRTSFLVLPLLFACRNEGNINAHEETGLDADTGETEELDPEDFEEAILRIIEPASATTLPYGELAHFQAELMDQDGKPLNYQEIIWTSTGDPAWEGQGLDFMSGDLDVGEHEITAMAYLPNDDRVLHTVGGILVQSPYAGTFVGLFVSTVTMQDLPIPCSGAAVLVVEPYGQGVTGNGTCVTSVMGMELELAYTFDLVNTGGVLSGTAAADIFGMFEYDFEVVGGTHDTQDINFAFGGDVMGMMQLEADVRAERINDDSGL